MSQRLIRGIHVLPNGSVSEVRIKRSDWVNEVSRLMDGAYVEPVNNLGGIAAMLLDEDGIAKKLPFNATATRIATELAGREVVPLLGPVIFTGPIRNGFIKDLDEHIGIRYINEG